MKDNASRWMEPLLWTVLALVLLGLLSANALKAQSFWLVPLSAFLPGLLCLRLPKPWPLGGMALMLWGIGEAVAVQGTVLFPGVLLADVIFIVGYLGWILMFLQVKNTRPPRLVLLLTLPMLLFTVWLNLLVPWTSIAIIYPLLDCIILLVAAPAAQAFLEGKAPLSRAVWLMTFYAFVLIDTLYGLERSNESWSLTSIGNLSYAMLYVNCAVGVALEATRRRQDIKPLILGVFVVVMVRSLVTIEDNGTVLTKVILAAFFYMTFTALAGLVVSFVNHQKEAQSRYRTYVNTLKKILVPFQQRLTTGNPTHPELQQALTVLQQAIPDLQGVKVHSREPFQWGQETLHWVDRQCALPEGDSIPVRFYLKDPHPESEALEAAQDALEHLLFFADHHSVMEQQSNTDPLTGLMNRRSALEAMLGLARKAMQEKRSLSVVVIDVDHFKRVNDTHGHDVGDRVLLLLAQLLQNRLRSTDLTFRWGGEEFLLVFHGLEPAGARQVLLRLKEDFQRQCLQNLGFEVTFSAGVFGGVLSRREDVELWREQADRLLYEAKRSGRNHIQFETT
ncbi:GGDEF domain-containing protein [Deinococcus misasensis]|uniref:GGDEF domain-containing protein n=1 Tax=Deinococcus misasensis TaxID=392413 RepID=UPI00068ED8C9|nr:GGDEF domain-containing protein [Deinococcus misasensis]